LSTQHLYLINILLVCSPVNKDRVIDAIFSLPRMQLSAEDLPGTPTTLQVCTPVLGFACHQHVCSAELSSWVTVATCFAALRFALPHCTDVNEAMLCHAV